MEGATSAVDHAGPVAGLYYFDNFISAKEEAQIVSLIDSRPFSEAIHRKQQFWGELYYHTTHDVTAVQPNDTYSKPGHQFDLQPMRWLVDRFVTDMPYSSCPVFRNTDCMPNQCLVNEYVANQGISSHFEDTNSFGDAIMTVSLLSPIFMTLKKPAIPTNQCQEILEEHKLLLKPRSCLMMSGEARYRWRHGIAKTKILEMPDGCTVYRGQDYRRLSLTIRRVLDTRRRADHDTEGWLQHTAPVLY
eukprot:jgi/Ulvmu1/10043/UM059_0093.1